eukprot:scaffold26751_cov67-Cyclotella_meneghiniana.AAC.3
MADNSTNSSDEQAEFHRKMWLALAPLEVEEHENTTDESPQQLDISRYPATTDDPVILDSSNIISSDEAEFRRKAWLALAPLYEPTTLDSNCAENNMIEDTKKVEQGDHLRPDESLSDLQRPVISSGRVASGCSPSLAARSSSIEGSLKGSQKRKAGDMDRPSQRHYSYPSLPMQACCSIVIRSGLHPKAGFTLTLLLAISCQIFLHLIVVKFSSI